MMNITVLNPIFWVLCLNNNIPNDPPIAPPAKDTRNRSVSEIL